MNAKTKRTGTKGVPRAEREAALLDAAVLEFSLCGYAATSVEAVAARAGVSKSLIHAYFDTKEGLYCACVSRAGDELVGRVAQALARRGESVTHFASDVLHSVFVALEPRPHDWKVLYDNSLPAGSVAEETARRYRRQLTQQGAVGVADSFAHKLPDPRDLSALTYIWTNTVTSMVNWWLRNPDQTAQQMAERGERILNALVD
ncbi:MAG: TetR/AcrR family transcriptional regulator [Segniliparus sp.]|uniref:TetR/AcrR family transcriptional regulator n=1 Tax=Segniliparus sp. TaxID=2804064 RepID=UPI003F31F8D6